MNSAHESNPFSTRFVRPGVIEYVPYDGRSLAALVDDFFARGRGWASIVGPHGSGKSTLMASLESLIAAKQPVMVYRFNTSNRDACGLFRESKTWLTDCVVMIDGYEQLSLWTRWRLARGVRSRKASLLVTAHRPPRGFTVLWDTHIDETTASMLRDRLLSSRLDLLHAPDLESVWCESRRQFPTDLRETLMSMYDWVEARRGK